MKQIIILASISLLLFSCGSSRKVVERNPYKKSVTKEAGLKNYESNYSGNNSSAINKILKDAEKYIGAPYKYGGNTASGFDCSGYTVKVFNENNTQLPRRSEDQSNAGKEISIKDTKPGDLIFSQLLAVQKFLTLALYTDIGNDGEVKFIHASTSKGVIISSLNEKYWNKAYLFARRVL